MSVLSKPGFNLANNLILVTVQYETMSQHANVESAKNIVKLMEYLVVHTQFGGGFRCPRGCATGRFGTVVLLAAASR